MYLLLLIIFCIIFIFSFFVLFLLNIFYPNYFNSSEEKHEYITTLIDLGVNPFED